MSSRTIVRVLNPVERHILATLDGEARTAQAAYTAVIQAMCPEALAPGCTLDLSTGIITREEAADGTAGGQ